MPSLEVLYLQQNQISVMAPLLGQSSLRLVNLSFNQLSQPAATLDAFVLLPALAELFLNGNLLETDPM